MRRIYVYFSIICCLAFLLPCSLAWAGSAISIPVEAHDTIAEAITAAQDILEKDQEMLNRAEAKVNLQKAKSDLMTAEKQAAEAEKLFAQYSIAAENAASQAAAAAQQASEAVEIAAVLGEEAGNAAAAVQIAYQSARAIENSLQAEEIARAKAISTRPKPAAQSEAAKYSPLEDTDELLKLEKEIKTLEKMQKDAELALRKSIPALKPQELLPVDWSKAETAFAYADSLNQIAIAADKKAEQAELRAEQLTTLAEKAAEDAAKAELAKREARVALDDARVHIYQAQNYVQQAKTELEQLIYLQEHPKGSHSFSVGTNYYNGHDNGNSFYQFTQPVQFDYWQKDFSYGLYTKHIISHNKTAGASGRVDTFSDTTLTLSKRNEKPKSIVDYGLNINIPTGKSALSWSERYAMMNEDQVDVSQFGKGWEVTPEIDVSRKIGKEDTWTIGTSYAFTGSYDPTSDIPQDTVSPGNEWRRFLRWQHAGQAWQFVGELSNTSTALTKIAKGDSYSTEDQWEYRLTYNRKLSQNQNIMVYYWRDNQNANTIVPFDTDDAFVHYFGTMWSKKLDDKHALRVTIDIMKSNGSRYAGINNYYPQYTSINVDGRTKYTVGLGYDIQINQSSKISVDLQKFRMEDGKSLQQPPTTSPTIYKGFNILSKYNMSI